MKGSIFLSVQQLSLRRGLRLAVYVLVSCALIAPAGAARTSAPEKVLDGETRRTVIRGVEDAIRTTYVFAEMRPALIAKLEQSLAAGRYDLNDPNLFAARVTEDLEAVSHDGHLYLSSDPEQYAAAIEPSTSNTGLDAYRKRLAIRTNSGLTMQEILPGNLRYLRIEAFHWTPILTRESYDSAVKFLRDGDGLVLDLRENGGGNSDAVDYLAKLLRPLAKKKPLYILVDAHVASAAEAISYGLQQEKLATIVGSNTYGAANNNKKVPISPQFIVSVSYNRPINPITGTNWEGVGVAPDITVQSSEALAAAELDAYHRLSAIPGVTAERLAEFAWGAVAAEAKVHPVTIPSNHLQTLAGDYGTIAIGFEKGELRLSRSDRPKWRKNILLIPLEKNDTFQVEGSEDLRVRFTTSGLDLFHGAEDQREPFCRTAAAK